MGLQKRVRREEGGELPWNKMGISKRLVFENVFNFLVCSQDVLLRWFLSSFSVYKRDSSFEPYWIRVLMKLSYLVDVDVERKHPME